MGVALRCLRISPAQTPNYNFFVDCVDHNEVHSYVLCPETAEQVYNEEVKPHFAQIDNIYRLRLDKELNLSEFYPPLKHKIVIYDQRVGSFFWQPEPPLWLDGPDDTGTSSPTILVDAFTDERYAQRSIDFSANVIPYLYPTLQTKIFEMHSTEPRDLINTTINTDQTESCLDEETQEKLYHAMPRNHPVMLQIRPISPEKWKNVKYTDKFEPVQLRNLIAKRQRGKFPRKRAPLVDASQIPGLGLGLHIPDDDLQKDHPLRPVRLIRIPKASGIWVPRSTPISTILQFLRMDTDKPFKIRLWLGDDKYKANDFLILDNERQGLHPEVELFPSEASDRYLYATPHFVSATGAKSRLQSVSDC
jgi:hypothetical protein